MRLLVLICIVLSGGTTHAQQIVEDSTFADDGFALVKVGPEAIQYARDAVVLPDGGVVITGTAYPEPGSFVGFVARLDTDGSPSTSFGTNGVVRFGAGSTIGEVSLEAVDAFQDGRIVLTGGRRTSALGALEAVVIVLNAGGQPDVTFGQEGVVVVGLPGESSSGLQVVADESGRVYVAGEIGGAFNRGFVARASRSGLDPTYGVSGRFTMPARTFLRDLAVRPDGRVLAVGTGYTDAAAAALFAGLTRTGEIDLGFGLFTRPAEYSGTVRLLPDGRALVGGRTVWGDGQTRLWMVRADGSLDAAFGSAGIADHDVIPSAEAGFGSEEPTGLARLGGGAFAVSVGGALNDGFRMLVVRPNGAPDLENGPQGVRRLFPDRPSLSVSGVAPSISESDIVVSFGSSFTASGPHTFDGVEPFVARMIVSRSPVSAETPAEAQAAALSVAPNPVAHAARITLALAETARATVCVVDALGRTVAVLADGVLGAGPHTLALDAARLPPGVYAVVATVGSERSVTRVTVVR